MGNIIQSDFVTIANLGPLNVEILCKLFATLKMTIYLIDVKNCYLTL
jgi:hypothetical protein